MSPVCLTVLVVLAMAATSAAVVQLIVPVIAAAGGMVFLGEPVTLRLLLATLAILGGVALFLSQGSRRQQTVS